MDIKIPGTISTELSPGSTKRRWLPPEGETKLRHKIHRESKFANDNKKLPFSFSKPNKNKRQIYIKCLNCGNITTSNINTIGIICKECNTYSSVEEVHMDE